MGEPTGDENHDTEREQRLRALSTLAYDPTIPQAGTPPPETSRFSQVEEPRLSLRPPKRRRRSVFVLAIASLLLVVIIAGVALSRAQRPSVNSSLAGSRVIGFAPQDHFLNCEKDVSWSPDGQSIAILGYERHCPIPAANNYIYWQGLVQIYSAKNGKLLRQILLDPTIDAALHLTPPTNATPAPRSGGGNGEAQQIIDYYHLLWSSDSSTLAITFLVGEWPWTSGLLLMSSSGADTRILSHVQSRSDSGYGTWDLTTGAFTPDPISTLALAYTWGAGGALVPQGVLSADAAPAALPLGPVGNPNGQPSFTIWQPATIGEMFARQSTTPIAGVYYYEANFAAWSPDGRYLTEMDLPALIEPGTPPAPAKADLTRMVGNLLPLLPVRDRAFAGVFSQFATASDIQQLTMHVAWSPNGKLLAVQSLWIDSASGQTDLSTYKVGIYDCATGKLLATLRPTTVIQPLAEFDNTSFRWSPDGTRLLLWDSNFGTLTIWPVPQK